MKKIMTALVVMATTISASANHLHNAGCKINCPENVTTMVTVPSSGFDGKMAELKNASDDRKSMIRYDNTMKNLLSEVEKQKHQNAIENLAAENAYSNLMASILDKVEQEKYEDQVEDITAAKRYEDLMVKIFTDTAKK